MNTHSPARPALSATLDAMPCSSLSNIMCHSMSPTLQVLQSLCQVEYSSLTCIFSLKSVLGAVIHLQKVVEERETKETEEEGTDCNLHGHLDSTIKTVTPAFCCWRSYAILLIEALSSCVMCLALKFKWIFPLPMKLLTDY